jgi:copper chaperone
VKTMELKIEGMSCGHCRASAQGALEKVPGVHEATVDLAAGAGRIVADDDVAPSALIEAVKAAGYEAKVPG